jgi:hypothetical protein
MLRLGTSVLTLVALGLLGACGGEDDDAIGAAGDPDSAPEAMIDRFSATAGHLQVRDASNGLPAAGAPVDFDREPFTTRGLGPRGEHVRYYNFDVQPTDPAPLYVLYREGESRPVEGQLDIVDAIPGQAGYNDFQQVMQVLVPSDYVANSVTSMDEVVAAGYAIESTQTLVNRPIVPAGSTASERWGGASSDLVRGWYRGEVVYSFLFEQELSGPSVPAITIYVSFNLNPDQDGGGPASGFKTEAGSTQTHNVITALPGELGYSPLWSVDPYDNADFPGVRDLASIADASVLADGVALVNCPVVSAAAP